MKRNIIIHALTVALVFMVAQASAQDEKDHHNRNYLRGGYLLSDLVGDDAFDTRSGFYAGYHHTLIKAPLIGFSLGLEYNQAGANKEQFGWQGGYLGVPANARLKLGPVYLDGGLGISYLLSDKTTVNGQVLSSGEAAENWDVLVHGGVGVKLFFLGIETRYRYGLTEVFEGQQNTGLQFGLVHFPLIAIASTHLALDIRVGTIHL